MDDVLIIGGGPAGLLAAWVARQNGQKARVLATGIGSTHISPGWIGVLNGAGALEPALDRWIAGHPQHPYALAGSDALQGGIAALRAVCATASLDYEGDLSANYRLPTALGALVEAALVPKTFAAGDVRQPGAMLIAGPQGWRDFYPGLCAGNLARQGQEARSVAFDLPEMRAGQFDLTPPGLARLFDRPDVRLRVAGQLKPQLGDAARVGFPAILGLERNTEAWLDLQERLGRPVFEIPTLPPSVPGMRLYNAFKRALTRAGVQILLDMTVARGLVDGTRASGAVVPGAARETIFRAGRIVLATGGLYGGGVTTDYRGEICETVFGLPVEGLASLGEWFSDTLLTGEDHPIHSTGVRANAHLQPVDGRGNVLLENVHVAGRLLGGYSPLVEGSTEGVWLATGYRAAISDHEMLG